jgi:hypothetical protein
VWRRWSFGLGLQGFGHEDVGTGGGKRSRISALYYSRLNARGIGERDKFNAIVKLAQYNHTDLIVLTETHITDTRLNRLQSEFPPERTSSQRNRSRG